MLELGATEKDKRLLELEDKVSRVSKTIEIPTNLRIPRLISRRRYCLNIEMYRRFNLIRNHASFSTLVFDEIDRSNYARFNAKSFPIQLDNSLESMAPAFINLNFNCKSKKPIIPA